MLARKFIRSLPPPKGASAASVFSPALSPADLFPASLAVVRGLTTPPQLLPVPGLGRPLNRSLNASRHGENKSRTQAAKCDVIRPVARLRDGWWQEDIG